MTYFAVLREAGPNWADGGIADQQELSEHSVFMDGLAEAGFALCAGPLDGSQDGRLRALLIVRADREAEIIDHLAQDPWSATGRLRIANIDTWDVFLGSHRLRVDVPA